MRLHFLSRLHTINCYNYIHCHMIFLYTLITYIVIKKSYNNVCNLCLGFPRLLFPATIPCYTEDNTARNGSRGSSRVYRRQTWDTYITYAFGTMTTISRVAEDRHRFRKDILESDVLKRIYSVNK